MVKIGSRYWSNRERLCEEIRGGQIKLFFGEISARCYFCSSNNRNCNVMIVKISEIRGNEVKERYFSHRNCLSEIIKNYNGRSTEIN